QTERCFMGGLIPKAGLIDRVAFDGLLRAELPEVAAGIDDDDRELLHLEMAAVARATCAAIESNDAQRWRGTSTSSIASSRRRRRMWRTPFTSRIWCGISLEFPRQRTVSIADGLAIAESFFATGPDFLRIGIGPRRRSETLTRVRAVSSIREDG